LAGVVVCGEFVDGMLNCGFVVHCVESPQLTEAIRRLVCHKVDYQVVM
jgi:hypothetical protein